MLRKKAIALKKEKRPCERSPDGRRPSISTRWINRIIPQVRDFVYWHRAAARPSDSVRPGAGRKPLADEPTIEGTITLTTSLDAKAKRIGAGNRSAGIRKALETFTE